MSIPGLEFCLVSQPDYGSLDAYFQFLQRAIEGGVRSIQLRDKTQSKELVHQTAQALQNFLRPYKIPLIINDYVDIAKDINAQGVHLGQTDFCPMKARAILGADKIIGWSVESFQDVEKANQLTCLDYIGVSAVFQSQTKPDCKTIWGLSGLKEVLQRCKHPAVAIGGITHNNAREVIAQGAYGVAVVSAIYAYLDSYLSAKLLAQEISKGKNDGRKNC